MLADTRKDRQTVTREKVNKQERLRKHREKRWRKSDKKAMNDLLIQAKAIIYFN